MYREIQDYQNVSYAVGAAEKTKDYRTSDDVVDDAGRKEHFVLLEGKQKARKNKTEEDRRRKKKTYALLTNYKLQRMMMYQKTTIGQQHESAKYGRR